MEPQSDDARFTELETLEAIFPEIHYPDPKKDPFTFDIDLPVQPESPVTVIFPKTVTVNDPGPSTAAVVSAAERDSLQITHLPALSLRITLPEGYPEAKPPIVKIYTDPLWLPPQVLKRLEDEGSELWEDCGRDMVAFTYIDHLQRAVDNVFGSITSEGTLEVDAQHKLAVIDHDIKAKKAAFERESFECGVCLDPKKGSKCHKMLDCGHIFCLQCLQDFYNDAIDQGNLSVVRCLTPGCAKDRAALKKQGSSASQSNPSKVSVSPSELLQIGIAEETVKRYVALKYKTELESDKNTIYCPRQWCNGAARSKKHKKPLGLEFTESSDHDDDDDNGEQQQQQKGPEKKGKNTTKFNPADLLAVCEDCGLAFCSRCFQSWHGEYFICAPRRTDGEMTEEDKASLEYLKLHTSPCPTCNAPAQKTHGCNHMICSRCDSHFCYLCSSWLDPTNPYRHYNEQPGGKFTSCYMRLWELEGGDGDDVGLVFGGGGGGGEHRNGGDGVAEVGDEMAALQVEEIADLGLEQQIIEGEEEGGGGEREGPEQQPNAQPDGVDGPIEVAREAPLVLRVVGNQPNNNPPAIPQDPAAGRQGQRDDHRGGRRRGRGAAGGGGAGRGRGGGEAGVHGGRGRGRGGGARGRQQQDNHAQHGRQGGRDENAEAWNNFFLRMMDLGT